MFPTTLKKKMHVLFAHIIILFLAGVEPNSGRRQEYIRTLEAPDTTHKRLPAPAEGISTEVLLTKMRIFLTSHRLSARSYLREVVRMEETTVLFLKGFSSKVKQRTRCLDSTHTHTHTHI